MKEKMLTCPKCGVSNLSWHLHCQSCGGLLREPEAIAASRKVALKVGKEKLVKIIILWVTGIAGALTVVVSLFLFMLFLIVVPRPDLIQLPAWLSDILLIVAYLVYIGIVCGMGFGVYHGLVWAWKLVEKTVKARSNRIALAYLATALLLLAFIIFGMLLSEYFAHWFGSWRRMSFLLVGAVCLSVACFALNGVWRKVS